VYCSHISGLVHSATNSAYRQTDGKRMPNAPNEVKHHNLDHHYSIFRLDALALSVIATATWLGGWLSHSGIVSKPLNLSETFFDHLKAPSL